MEGGGGWKKAKPEGHTSSIEYRHSQHSILLMSEGQTRKPNQKAITEGHASPMQTPQDRQPPPSLDRITYTRENITFSATRSVNMMYFQPVQNEYRHWDSSLTVNQPETHGAVREWRNMFDEYTKQTGREM